MAKEPEPRTDRGTPTSTGAALGSSGAEVEKLQKYLSRYGYFDDGTHARFGMTAAGTERPPSKSGQFCDRTEGALRKFQQFAGLPATGVLDDDTVALMGHKRCGCPDLGEYVAQGNKWNSNALRYGFVEFSPDLSQAQIRAAIHTALGYWAAVTPLSFSEVANAANPEIRIRFVSGDHGDGSPFDGQSGVLAHAYYPPPNGGDIAGDTHFDEAENWSVNLPPAGIDLYTVAAHEFGHALGLAHSTVNQALMYPYYGGPHRYLHQDDIDGIQAIYGAQQTFSNKLLLRTFATYHSKNAWAYVQDVGWRKINPQNPEGVTAMFATACDARANGGRVTVQATAQNLLQIYA